MKWSKMIILAEILSNIKIRFNQFLVEFAHFGFKFTWNLREIIIIEGTG